MIRAAASAAKWERRFLRARVPSALAAGGSLCAGAAHPALASCGQALFFEAPHELLSATPRSRALMKLEGLGVRALRVELHWRDVAPAANASRRPGAPGARRHDGARAGSPAARRQLQDAGACAD